MPVLLTYGLSESLLKLNSRKIFHRCYNDGALVNRMQSTQQSFLQQLLATEKMLLRLAIAYGSSMYAALRLQGILTTADCPS